MNAPDFRQNIRREEERRLIERREVLFEFGSEEWCQFIQQEYLLWPKKDRRNIDRRSLARRQTFRRVGNSRRPVKVLRPQNVSALLTNEERDMINELIRSGNEE